MNQSLQKIDGDLPLAVQPSGSPMELMVMAIQGKADVAVLERLEAMQERFDKRKAKKEYDEAMAAFQAKCPVIMKTVDGAQKKYKFAPLDHIVSQVKPILEECGFSYRLTSEMEAGFVKSVMTITHRGGHSEQSEFKVPVDTRNPVMSEPQKYGGAMTFANRYNFCNGFGILTANEDQDGQTARAKIPAWLIPTLEAEEAARAIALPPAPKPAPTKPPPNPIKAKLWLACQPIRGTAQSWDTAESWMRMKKIITPDQKVSTLTDAQMETALDKVQIELSNT
jgi:hypothetical protein